MRKKIIPIAAAVVLIVAAANLFGPGIVKKIGGENVITASRLGKAINISQLSTAEFVYNGVAEKHEAENPQNIECYIAYNANVKVGIEMEEVTFTIDEENKTVTPVLPEIEINIAALDENSLSYIPRNPDIPLKEVITICKEDAVSEANNSKQLYQTAQENLQAVIEALLTPLLEDAGYSIVW